MFPFLFGKYSVKEMSFPPLNSWCYDANNMRSCWLFVWSEKQEVTSLFVFTLFSDTIDSIFISMASLLNEEEESNVFLWCHLVLNTNTRWSYWSMFVRLLGVTSLSGSRSSLLGHRHGDVWGWTSQRLGHKVISCFQGNHFLTSAGQTILSEVASLLLSDLMKEYLMVSP